MSDKVDIYVSGLTYTKTHDNSDSVGNGGYGVVIVINDLKQFEIAGGFSNTTAARMEIMGSIEGLRRINTPSEVTIHVINGYVVDTVAKGWLQKWKKEGFKNKKHVELWKIVDHLLATQGHKANFVHAKKVKRSKEYLLAVDLAEMMRENKNLPTDSPNGSLTNSLFQGNDTSLEDELIEEENSTPDLDSISVDASSLGNPGITEYRGVISATKEVLFNMKYDQATNNIGEFLAIVYALAYCKRENLPFKIIYSDSLNAISWVRKKKCRTKLNRMDQNAIVFDHIQRAEIWLKNNPYDIKVLKWNTVKWGEIPADYGRK